MSQDQKDALHTGYVKFGAASPAAPVGCEHCIDTYCLSGERCRHCGHESEGQGIKRAASASPVAPAAPVEPVITAPHVEQWDLYGTGIKPWSHRVPAHSQLQDVADAMQAELNDLRAHLARQAQPTDRDAVLDDVEEAAGILDSFIDNVATDGPYSAEATLAFISQAKQCVDSAIRALKGKSGSGSPAAEPDADALDAARYRWLLSNPQCVTWGDFYDRTWLGSLATVSDAIDAAMAGSGSASEGAAE